MKDSIDGKQDECALHQWEIKWVNKKIEEEQNEERHNSLITVTGQNLSFVDFGWYGPVDSWLMDKVDPALFAATHLAYLSGLWYVIATNRWMCPCHRDVDNSIL